MRMSPFYAAAVAITGFIIWALFPGINLFYICVVALTGFMVWTLVQEQKRAKQIRQFAQNAGFTYVGAALPKSFPLRKTSVHWASSFWNAVAGDKHGKELLFFDCRFGTGKTSTAQTVVALRGSAESLGPVRFGPGWTMETVDDWALIYRSEELLPLKEIEAVLSRV
jgi:hypothetical protein